MWKYLKENFIVVGCLVLVLGLAKVSAYILDISFTQAMGVVALISVIRLAMDMDKIRKKIDM